MTMKDPVARLSSYASWAIGSERTSRTRPISFRARVDAGAGSRVLTSTRSRSVSTRQKTCLVPCLRRYCRPGVISVSLIHTKVASMVSETRGWFAGLANTSPRLTSIWSARVSVTAMGGTASSMSPSIETMRATSVVRPDGRTTTESPGRTAPLATLPL